MRRANIGAQFCAPRKFWAQLFPPAQFFRRPRISPSALSRWDDLFAQRKIDQGKFYASKDNLYPTAAGGTRRINWGWATVPPASTQTLPREITFNAAARALHQYPIEEVKALRGPAAVSRKGVAVAGTTDLGLKAGVAKQSEVVVTFTLPATAATLGVTLGAVNASSGTKVARRMNGTDMGGDDYSVKHDDRTDVEAATADCQATCDKDPQCEAWTYVVRGAPAGSGDCCLKSGEPCPKPDATCTSGAKTAGSVAGCGDEDSLSCTIEFSPPADASKAYDVPVTCGGYKDTLTLVPGEVSVELRIFLDWTMVEVYFQQGRVAMTAALAMDDSTAVALTSADPPAALATADVEVYPMKSIWTTADAVRKQKRVFG